MELRKLNGTVMGRKLQRNQRESHKRSKTSMKLKHHQQNRAHPENFNTGQRQDHMTYNITLC